MPPEATGTGPASVLGHYCDVKFEEDSEWYRAIVRGYDRATKLHNLWYEYDGEVRPFSVTNCLKLCLPGPTSSNTSLHAIPKEASAYTALGCILDSSVPSELKPCKTAKSVVALQHGHRWSLHVKRLMHMSFVG